MAIPMQLTAPSAGARDSLKRSLSPGVQDDFALRAVVRADACARSRQDVTQ
jgi:hypothetical protein